jgi:predicted amidophosphoribosyltransferase
MAERGRPREHDREKIAHDLIEWAKKDDSINLNKFCAFNEIVPSKISQWAKEDDNFRQAYELAKSFIGYRREEMLNREELHVKAYDLNATNYDYFLRDEKRQQSEFEAALKSQEIEKYTQDDLNKYQSLMSQLDKLQSDLKNADSNNNSE